MLADGCTRTGRFNEARVALNEALALVEKNDERFQEAELHRLKGELLLAELGDQTAAEQCFRQAVEISPAPAEQSVGTARHERASPDFGKSKAAAKKRSGRSARWRRLH